MEVRNCLLYIACIPHNFRDIELYTLHVDLHGVKQRDVSTVTVVTQCKFN